MSQTVQMVLAGILALLFGLSALSRRFPDVGWLQLFRIERPQLSDEQRARMRQRSTILAGLEMILLGIVIPAVYFIGTIMMFNEPTATGMVISLAASLLLIGLGIAAIVRSRRRA
jgi:hypothetical protein